MLQGRRPYVRAQFFSPRSHERNSLDVEERDAFCQCLSKMATAQAWAWLGYFCCISLHELGSKIFVASVCTMSNSRPQEMPGSTGSGLAVSRVHTERSDGSSRSRAGQAGSDGLGKGNSGDAASHGRKSDASDFFSSLVEPATSSGGRSHGSNQGNSGDAASHGRKSDASDFFSSLVEPATSSGGRLRMGENMMPPTSSAPWWSQPRLRAAARTVPTRATAATWLRMGENMMPPTSSAL